MGADARLTGRAVWETITFLLNGFVFLVTGLEVPLLLRTLTPALAGLMLEHSTFGWPLIAGGVLKATYDILLLRQPLDRD